MKEYKKGDRKVMLVGHVSFTAVHFAAAWDVLFISTESGSGVDSMTGPFDYVRRSDSPRVGDLLILEFETDNALRKDGWDRRLWKVVKDEG
jgi:hypothetical protein